LESETEIGDSQDREIE